MATVYSEDGSTYTSGGITYESSTGRPITEDGGYLLAQEQADADFQYRIDNTESSEESFLADEGPQFNTFQDKSKKKYGAYAGTEAYDKARAQELETRKRLGRYSQKKRGGVLRYPLEALTEHTDYLQIDIEKYVPLGSYASAPGDDNRYVTGNYFGSDRAGRRSSSRLSNKPLINDGTILLPIPANLQDTNNVQYDTSTLNGLAAAGVEAATGVMGIDVTKGFGSALGQLTDVKDACLLYTSDAADE